SPWRALNVWGYAEALRADVGLRGRALLAAPLALSAGVLALLRVTAEHRTENQEPRTTQLEQRTENKEQNDDATHITQHHSQSQIRNSQLAPSAGFPAQWVLPNGPPAALAARLRGLPLVISLHGSDVYLAERAAPLSLAAAGALRASSAVTACSRDLRERAL